MIGRFLRRGFVLLFLVSGKIGVVGCVGWSDSATQSTAVGTSSMGLLRAGVSLPDEGEGFVRVRPGESTRWGVRRLVEGIQDAAVSVARHFPATAALKVGDLSGPLGGRHPRHGSHRSGLDVDLLFYVEDIGGRSVRNPGWTPFSRFGYARLPAGQRQGIPGDGFVFFDDARNWQLVRSLLLNHHLGVQWIFCSSGVKARLLRYAINHERSAEAIHRAAYVLHQPSRGNPHDDHFHVRVMCTPRERALGCRNRGPMWTWLREGWEKGYGNAQEAALSDEALLREVLGSMSD